MGTDKRFLRVGNENLLERQIRVLGTRFPEIIISANDPEKLAYLNLPVIRDEQMGMGPLGGLTTALAASDSEYNFVLAADIPIIDMQLVEKMLTHLNNVSAVIPVSIDGHQEPLFAFYSKNCIPIFKQALKEGERAIHRALRKCPVYHFPMKNQTPIKNLNNPSDFDTFLKENE
ncbi:MAG: molybdenum cofactor guanylyltransferase [Candidatus Marinimicrobia bacterium]|nr:molybdenum cofactor guanylyltransferase [Candidatus Neomarinimicrobiota bacterium]